MLCQNQKSEGGERHSWPEREFPGFSIIIFLGWIDMSMVEVS
jgi:hypothetical protein